MPVPTHLRVVFRGEFVGTPETWSFGLKFSRDNPAGDDANLGDIDIAGMATDCGTFMGTSGARFPGHCKLLDVRGYIIGTDGKMEGNPEIVDVSSLGLLGASTSTHPPQVCLVMTHVAADRGPARFGRTFLPTAAPLVSTDLRVSTANAATIREAYTTFVKACSNRIDLELTQSAVQLNISDRAGGVRQTVDHHEVGRVLDTLRSRRRAMDEDRLPGGHIDW
jgi:hypothetical protein